MTAETRGACNVRTLASKLQQSISATQDAGTCQPTAVHQQLARAASQSELQLLCTARLLLLLLSSHCLPAFTVVCCCGICSCRAVGAAVLLLPAACFRCRQRCMSFRHVYHAAFAAAQLAPKCAHQCCLFVASSRADKLLQCRCNAATAVLVLHVVDEVLAATAGCAACLLHVTLFVLPDILLLKPLQASHSPSAACTAAPFSATAATACTAGRQPHQTKRGVRSLPDKFIGYISFIKALYFRVSGCFSPRSCFLDRGAAAIALRGQRTGPIRRRMQGLVATFFAVAARAARCCASAMVD
jgi:hypothetical protein